MRNNSTFITTPPAINNFSEIKVTKSAKRMSISELKTEIKELTVAQPHKPKQAYKAHVLNSLCKTLDHQYITLLRTELAHRLLLLPPIPHTIPRKPHTPRKSPHIHYNNTERST